MFGSFNPNLNTHLNTKDFEHSSPIKRRGIKDKTQREERKSERALLKNS